MRINGSTALITGAGAGIGLGVARSVARRGGRLALTDIDTDALALAATELAALTEVTTFELDVRDRDMFSKVADRAEQQLGPIDLLCNNAGLAFPETVDDMSYELWDLALGINLGGVVNGIQTFLPRMLERGQPAHIVNTASAAGLLPAAGYAYTTSKYAVVGLSESLAQRLAADGYPLGLSVLCPGAVATNLARTTQRTLASQQGGHAFTHARERITGLTSTVEDTLHQFGTDPDQVGDLVTDAISHDRLYVLTDHTGANMIAERTQKILDAMPAGAPAGGSAEDFLRRVRGNDQPAENT